MDPDHDYCCGRFEAPVYVLWAVLLWADAAGAAARKNQACTCTLCSPGVVWWPVGFSFHPKRSPKLLYSTTRLLQPSAVSVWPNRPIMLSKAISSCYSKRADMLNLPGSTLCAHPRPILVPPSNPDNSAYQKVPCLPKRVFPRTQWLPSCLRIAPPTLGMLRTKMLLMFRPLHMAWLSSAEHASPTRHQHQILLDRWMDRPPECYISISCSKFSPIFSPSGSWLLTFRIPHILQPFALSLFPPPQSREDSRSLLEEGGTSLRTFVVFSFVECIRTATLAFSNPRLRSSFPLRSPKEH